MITFETKNSVYTVETENGKFKITKVAMINPNSTYHAVGVPVYADYMSIEIGGIAAFHGGNQESWHTSKVVRVL